MQRTSNEQAAFDPEINPHVPPPIPATPPPPNPKQKLLNQLGYGLHEFIQHEKHLSKRMNQVYIPLQEVVNSTSSDEECTKLQLNHLAHVSRLSQDEENIFADFVLPNSLLSLQQLATCISQLKTCMTHAPDNTLFKEHLASCAWFTIHGTSLTEAGGPWANYYPTLASLFQYFPQGTSTLETLRNNLSLFHFFQLNLTVKEKKALFESNLIINHLYIRLKLVATAVNMIMAELGNATNYQNNNFLPGSILHDDLFSCVNKLIGYILEKLVIISFEVNSYIPPIRQKIHDELVRIGMRFEQTTCMQYTDTVVATLQATETRRKSDKKMLINELNNIMLENVLEPDEQKIRKKLETAIRQMSSDIHRSMRYHIWQRTDGRLQDALMELISHFNDSGSQDQTAAHNKMK